MSGLPLLDLHDGHLPGWFADAACLGMPSARFFGDDVTPLNVEAAAEVCARCPVAEECYRFAVAEGFSSGVFGGVNMGGRRAAA